MFKAAKERGLKLVAHAGEEGPPEYVTQALDLLQVDRIDHGNRALEDKTLVTRLTQEQIPMTVCPLSNFKLGVVNDMREHPVKQMLDLGLCISLHSDDPAFFGGYIGANFNAVIEALDLNKAQIKTLARNSITGSFLTDGEKRAHLAAIDMV